MVERMICFTVKVAQNVGKKFSTLQNTGYRCSSGRLQVGWVGAVLTGSVATSKVQPGITVANCWFDESLGNFVLLVFPWFRLKLN